MLLTVATELGDELHTTDSVRFWNVPSELFPVAANCKEAPTATVVAGGVTVIDTRVVDETVRLVEAVISPNAAEIVVVPTVTAEAFPPKKMVATEFKVELHITDDVRSRVLLSEKVPVAVNCWVVPKAMTGLAGVIAMDTSVAGVVATGAPDEWPPPHCIRNNEIRTDKDNAAKVFNVPPAGQEFDAMILN
jgi:hypothetical protein